MDSDIKYIPLNDKVIIDEQNNAAKFKKDENNNNNDNNHVDLDLLDQIKAHKVTDSDIDETRSRSIKFKNDHKLLNFLPEIKFSNTKRSHAQLHAVPTTASTTVQLEPSNLTTTTTTAPSQRNDLLSDTNNNNTDPNDYITTVYTESSIRNRSTLEKLFLIIIVILSIITISLIILLMYKSSFISHLNSYIKNQENEFEVEKNKLIKQFNQTCLTEKCILLSGNILNSMDLSVDPCEDFYEYSCGNWLKQTLIPRGYPRWSTIISRTYTNQLVLKDELENYYVYNSTILNNNFKNDLTNAEIKSILFYKSCIDNDGYIEKLKAKPLLDIINKFLYKDDENNLKFNETLSNLLHMSHIQYGLSAYFQLNVLDDDKNSSFNDIEISQGNIVLDRSYYLNRTIEKNEKAVQTLKQTLKNILQLIHGDINNLDKIIDNFIEYETKLAEIMIPYEKLANIENNYNRISLKNLTENIAPFLDWFNFTNELFNYYNVSEVVKNEDTIIVLGYEYFQNLTNLLKEYNSTEEKIFITKFSIYVHLLKFTLPLLSSEYRAQLNILNEALTGASLTERWQQCIDHVDSTTTLGFAVGRMFIRKKFNKAKTNAINMIKRIRDSFTANFPHVSWMDEETRHAAEDKIQAVTELIGFPDFILNDTQLNERYKELLIDETDYFGNELRLNTFALRNEIKMYRKRVLLDEWDMTPATVNAYYIPTRNQIVFPAGILQEPFFHVDYPQSVNYGGIGTIMGHELSHGFDDAGREYDKNGTLSQWWNDKTIDAYNNATACIADQYSQYKVNGENLNGKKTLGENIADNGALKTSYNAYLKWVEERGEELPLPLVNLTHKQLFFVAFAQAWCTKSTPDSVHLLLSVDTHSPPRYRVIGSISNSKEFSENFKCKPGTKMNPIKKCTIF